MNQIARLGAFVAMCALATVWVVRAADTTIPGKIHIIKEAKLTKMVAKGTFTPPTAGGTADPTVAGGMLEVFDTSDGLGFTSALPLAGWKGLGNPAGATGYKYKGAGSGGDPCKVVLVKGSVIKFVCKATQNLTPPLGGTSGIILSLGDERFCAEFGGTDVKNVAGLLKRKDASAPSACPFSSTSSSSSTSTSTSTTFDPSIPCCGNFTHGVFTSGPALGICGNVYNLNGMEFNVNNRGTPQESAGIICGGLYFGGGLNAVPLPAITPDLGATVVELTSCTGQQATIAPTTSAQTGSNLNCSSPDCYFGAPTPVPNTSTPSTSNCLMNTLSAPASGTVRCDLGTQETSIPLYTEIFLTGDTTFDPAGTIPGIQSCPLCSASTCIGGPNNGMSCTPGSTSQGLPGYPTSHDCPPGAPGDLAISIGTIPIGLQFTTGTVSWTGVPAANPTSTPQIHVFCGYCRDKNATSAFQNPFQQCWYNGAPVGPPCAEPFESCQQRDDGAYGPSGGNVKTITVFGSPAGPTVDGASHAQRLVTNYCVPPTFNATIDAVADLPGPSTLALTGNTELCASANPCPGP